MKWMFILLIAALAPSCEGTGGSGRGANDDTSGGDGTDTGSATADTDTESESSTGCEEVAFPVAGTPPDILVLIDRSNSMAWGSPSSWSMVTDAVVAITATMDAQIRFGLMLFPSGSTNCALPSTVPAVAIDDTTAAQIAAALAAASPDGGGTPTTGSLEIAATYLNTLFDGSPKYILLATDGAPNCSSDVNLSCDTCVGTQMGGGCYSQVDCLDDALALEMAQQIHDEWGISIYVVGVGGVLGAWDDVMSGIAFYGGTNDYYPAASPDDLAAALQEIAAAAVECTFDVDWSALGQGVSTDPGLVNVFADGDLVYYDEDCSEGTGWHWLDSDTIELCPELCEDYKNGEVSEVKATFGCESEVQ